MRIRTSLYLLTLLNLLNYVDRWLIAAIIPPMQAELHLSNTMAGFVMSAFMLGYFITSPFFGYLTDRFDRVRVMMAGTFVWSIATAISGLSQNGWHLIFSRSAVGVGEASTASAGPSLIADLFPKEKLNQAIALFTAAIPIGSALGFILGGVIENHFGWRSAFFMASVPGLIMVALLYFIKDPRTKGVGKGPQETLPFKKSISTLRTNAVYRNAVLGYAAFSFTVGGFASWAPKYLVSVRDVPLTQADTLFGVLTVVTGVVGSLIGGWGAGFAQKKKGMGHLRFSLIMVACAVPFSFLGFLLPQKPLYLTAMGLAEFFLFASQPAINVVILESVNPWLRGMASALCVFFIHLLGDFLSPPLVGILSDLFSLKIGVLLLPVALFANLFFYFRCLKLSLTTSPTRSSS